MSDYIKSLEKQNEELIASLSATQQELALAKSKLSIFEPFWHKSSGGIEYGSNIAPIANLFKSRHTDRWYVTFMDNALESSYGLAAPVNGEPDDGIVNIEDMKKYVETAVFDKAHCETLKYKPL